MKFYRRRFSQENLGAGEDSFLDIVSNMVGILIILVMIAGFRLGQAVPEDERASEEASALVSAPLSEKEGSPKSFPELEMLSEPDTLSIPQDPIAESSADSLPAEEEMKEYLHLAQRYQVCRNEILKIQTAVQSLNDQAQMLQRQREGSEQEYSALLGDTANLEAMLERARRSKSDTEVNQARQSAELMKLNEEIQSLEESRGALAAQKPKAAVIQNVPTPLTRKLEGNEAIFALEGGRISYVPMGEFVEQIRGRSQRQHDLSVTRIDDPLGPIDGYRFRFQASVHTETTPEGKRYAILMDYGEFFSIDALPGEPVDDAFSMNSVFQKKLTLFPKETSTITLAVYPDSFAQLRAVKKFLMERGYQIALRPMPAGKRIAVSPDGTESTIY